MLTVTTYSEGLNLTAGWARLGPRPSCSYASQLWPPDIQMSTSKICLVFWWMAECRSFVWHAKHLWARMGGKALKILTCREMVSLRQNEVGSNSGSFVFSCQRFIKHAPTVAEWYTLFLSVKYGHPTAQGVFHVIILLSRIYIEQAGEQARPLHHRRHAQQQQSAGAI